MSLVSSLNIAQQALAVNQAAITVVSNNIANVDNAEYSKLTVDLSDVVSYSELNGSTTSQADSLSGVQISSITRSSDDYLENYYRTENSDYSYLNEYSTVATSVEDTMNELNETGLTTALSDFYDAANSLSNDPTDITARQNYLSCAENVCSAFNSVFEDLTSQQNDLIGDSTVNGSCDTAEIGMDVDAVNDLLDQLADVNKSIVQTNSSTTSSSSLLDERDSILESLSDYMPITTTINDNGTANVSLGDYSLVKGSTVKGYLDVINKDMSSTETDSVQINIVDPDTGDVTHSDVNDSIDSGSIGAILDVTSSSTSSDLTINGVLSSLNTLASTFASTLNSLQSGTTTTTSGGVTTTTYAMCLSSDYDSLTASTEALFETSDDTATITAGNISINSDLEDNLYLIAAGTSTTGTTSTNVGDNSNMTRVSDSQTNTYTELGSQSFSDYLATEVAGIGTDVSNISTKLDTQSSVLDSIESTLSSKTGVSLDEELGELIKYQQAYEAAARIFTTCSDLIEELVQLGK
jgi:flagellar hook-associated protein 1